MTKLTSSYEAAIRYALHVHDADVRKGTEVPYASHLLAVSALVLEDGGDEDEAIAALLHDTAEDHGGEGRLSGVSARFGERVAGIVRLCSDSLAADSATKEAYLPRKRSYINHLWIRVSDPATDCGYLRVTLADKLHNARSIARDVEELGDALYRRFQKPEDSLASSKLKTQAYYCDLMRCFQHAPKPGLGPMVSAMDRELNAFCGAGRPSLFSSPFEPNATAPWNGHGAS